MTGTSMSSFNRNITISATLLCVALAACNQADAGKARADSLEAAEMNRGLGLLYRSSDPVGAERVFRDLLQRNPAHYGAQFQLAASIDRGGRPVDARPLWEKVLTSAQQSNDTATVRIVRARLAAPDTSSQDALMALGLDLLYTQKNATAAAEQFKKVLAKNPTHYGASYQLASALEKSGQLAQAKAAWQKVLGMAVMYKDTKVADEARAKLK